MYFACKYEMEELTGLLIRYLEQKIIFLVCNYREELDKKEARNAKKGTVAEITSCSPNIHSLIFL